MHVFRTDKIKVKNKIVKKAYICTAKKRHQKTTVVKLNYYLRRRGHAEVTSAIEARHATTFRDR